MNVRNPISGEIIGSIPMATSLEVAQAVERARVAQRTWGALSVRERGSLLRRWADLLWDNQEEGIQVIRRETGKPDAGAFIELMALDGVVSYHKEAPRILKPRSRKTLFPLCSAKVYYKPYGVVGIISPWNYPFLLPFMDLVPALFAGNTVVMKPSEITPFSAEFGVEMMYRAGIPRDVIQIVHGDGRAGATLVEQVDFVAFTGSTATGRKIAQKAAERLIPYTLELAQGSFAGTARCQPGYGSGGPAAWRI